MDHHRNQITACAQQKKKDVLPSHHVNKHAWNSLRNEAQTAKKTNYAKEIVNFMFAPLKGMQPPTTERDNPTHYQNESELAKNEK